MGMQQQYLTIILYQLLDLRCLCHIQSSLSFLQYSIHLVSLHIYTELELSLYAEIVHTSYSLNMRCNYKINRTILLLLLYIPYLVLYITICIMQQQQLNYFYIPPVGCHMQCSIPILYHNNMHRLNTYTPYIVPIYLTHTDE